MQNETEPFSSYENDFDRLTRRGKEYFFFFYFFLSGIIW